MLSAENGSDVILPNAKDIDYRDGGAAGAVSSEDSEKCKTMEEGKNFGGGKLKEGKDGTGSTVYLFIES